MVVRSDPSGKVTWDTNILVSIESMEIKESADQGDDVIISFKLKQFKEYGIQRITTAQKSPNTTSTSNNNREQNNAPSNLNSDSYVVRSGDTLWSISKKYYGNGAYYTRIYEANRTVIENAAKQNGRASSSQGSFIYPGTKLTIPSVG
jgi:nucleoid-associated protein YgaU